jgi:hypothetical protein
MPVSVQESESQLQSPKLRQPLPPVHSGTARCNAGEYRVVLARMKIDESDFGRRSL